MKKLLIFLLVIITKSSFSQIVNRDPDSRQDFANVYYNPNYILFDLWSDEPIFPDENGLYHIFYATNENKVPYSFNLTGKELSNYYVYNFKNYENCINGCNDVMFKRKKISKEITQTNTDNKTSNTTHKENTYQIQQQIASGVEGK